MTVLDGYALVQYSSDNKIVIYLPQTLDTAIDTATPVKERRKMLSSTEEATLLAIIKRMYEVKYG